MYEVVVEAGAAKGLRKLPRDVTERIAGELRNLGEDPRGPGAKKIVGSERFYRIRVGDYRIVYEVEDQSKRVIVMAIGHRKDVYRN
jgi:mRNA interferase RelE/StbE